MNRVRVVLPDGTDPIPAQDCKPGTVYRRAGNSHFAGDYYLCLGVFGDQDYLQFVHLGSHTTWTPVVFRGATFHEVGALELE